MGCGCMTFLSWFFLWICEYFMGCFTRLSLKQVGLFVQDAAHLNGEIGVALRFNAETGRSLACSLRCATFVTAPKVCNLKKD